MRLGSFYSTILVCIVGHPNTTNNNVSLFNGGLACLREKCRQRIITLTMAEILAMPTLLILHYSCCLALFSV